MVHKYFTTVGKCLVIELKTRIEIRWAELQLVERGRLNDRRTYQKREHHKFSCRVPISRVRSQLNCLKLIVDGCSFVWSLQLQAVPLYLSEMAPAHLRGGLNMMFQLATTLGIFTANMINYGTEKLRPWGWRLSLGLAAVPALFMTVGGLLLPETPNSLIERGHEEEGRRVLERIRGTRNVGAEFQDMVDASELANAIEHPFRNILEKRNRPQLVMAIFMPMFQILTGINSILFYAPVLFQSMGFGGNASLYSSVMTGAVLASSTLVSIATVDIVGRRALLIGGGIQMIVCQVSPATHALSLSKIEQTGTLDSPFGRAESS